MKNLLPAILAIAVVTMTSCGGSSAPKDGEESAAEAPEVKKMTPDDMAARIIENYVSAMGDLNEILADTPAADEVTPAIATLKEECIQKMVECGKMREELGSDEQSKLDLAVRIGMGDVYKDDVWVTYSELTNQYLNNYDFHQLISSFNIITQYAFFDLLKEQEPEEAQRLGIQ